MKDRSTRTNRPGVSSSGPGSANGGGGIAPSETEIDRNGILEDQRLVARCLAGEVKAWEELYCRCHQSLLGSIKVLLGRGDCDLNLVDEIAARVWYLLVADDGKLLARFDSERGCRLTTFLAALARSEAKGFFRAERRRRKREIAASRSQSDAHNLGEEQVFGATEDFLASAQIKEFLETLTPRERKFFTKFLLTSPSKGGRSPLAPLTIRQLTHRVQRKLEDFLSGES